MSRCCRRALDVALALGATVALSTLLGACGDDAVSTSTSLSSLGTQMADPARKAVQLVEGSTPGARSTVRDDATRDRSCAGGRRREFSATVRGDLGSQREADLRNALNLITQSQLKPAGAQVTTDLGGGSSRLPRTIDFANDPGDAAQQRTYSTETSAAGGAFTWTITGRTACVTRD